MPLSTGSKGNCSFLARTGPTLAVLAIMVVGPILSHGAIPSTRDHPSVADTLAADTLRAGGETVPAGKKPSLLITMGDGRRVVIELMPDKAPIAVQRILELVADGFYDGLSFHRVESYLVQIGKKDNELPSIEGEMFNQSLRHEKGMVGMARLVNDYDSATTQFYICKKDLSRLNGEYTLFGRVTEGMEIVEKIKKGDRIESIINLE